MDNPLVSIIINNYNYQKYIRETIDSALNQTYRNIEIIVVDDGSTDGSAKVINSYGKQLKSVYKQNGGQGSCFNVGFEVSSGEIIIFLDSDDTLLPHAITRIVEAFSGENIVKAYSPLLTMDQDSKPTGKMVPNTELEEGSLLQKTLLLGPASHANPPTSGNAWSRNFLNQVLPLPADDYRISADAYLFTLSPLFGNFAKIETPIGYYRIHQRSYTQKSPFALHRLEQDIKMHLNRIDELDFWATSLGYHHSKEGWKYNSMSFKVKLVVIRKMGLSKNNISFTTLAIHSVKNSFKSPKIIYQTLILMLIGILPIGPATKLASKFVFYRQKAIK